MTLPTHRVKRTRTGGVWVAAALFALLLLLLLIFILENGHRVAISHLGAHGHLPLGIALPLAAVIGVLLVVIPGTGGSSSCGSSRAVTAASTPRRRQYHPRPRTRLRLPRTPAPHSTAQE